MPGVPSIEGVTAAVIGGNDGFHGTLNIDTTGLGPYTGGGTFGRYRHPASSYQSNYYHYPTNECYPGIFGSDFGSTLYGFDFSSATLVNGKYRVWISGVGVSAEMVINDGFYVSFVNTMNKGAYNMLNGVAITDAVSGYGGGTGTNRPQNFVSELYPGNPTLNPLGKICYAPVPFQWSTEQVPIGNPGVYAVYQQNGNGSLNLNVADSIPTGMSIVGPSDAGDLDMTLDGHGMAQAALKAILNVLLYPDVVNANIPIIGPLLHNVNPSMYSAATNTLPQAVHEVGAFTDTYHKLMRAKGGLSYTIPSGFGYTSGGGSGGNLYGGGSWYGGYLAAAGNPGFPFICEFDHISGYIGVALFALMSKIYAHYGFTSLATTFATGHAGNLMSTLRSSPYSSYQGGGARTVFTAWYEGTLNLKGISVVDHGGVSVASSVNTGTGVVTFTGAGIPATGSPVWVTYQYYSSGGAVTGGLTNNHTYYVRQIAANQAAFFNNAADANANTNRITLTDTRINWFLCTCNSSANFDAMAAAQNDDTSVTGYGYIRRYAAISCLYWMDPTTYAAYGTLMNSDVVAADKSPETALV